MAKQQQTRLRIAAAAARLMAQDGIDDFALAKRKAARQLGLGDTQALPGNDEIEAQLRAYQGLYQEGEQRERLRELRIRALSFMREISEFHPYLTGQVLSGTAGRYSEITIQVFTDDAKSLELLFLNRNLNFDICEQRRWIGGEARTISVITLDWDGIETKLSILGAKDERVSMKTSAAGRIVERAAIPAVELLTTASGGNS
ncbi:MAG: hypothetical protein EXR28_12775 [Betaproteobacteria bacterium]|nr:hypothetical protein [Betaproteobacteria bacterium]